MRTFQPTLGPHGMFRLPSEARSQNVPSLHHSSDAVRADSLYRVGEELFVQVSLMFAMMMCRERL